MPTITLSRLLKLTSTITVIMGLLYIGAREYVIYYGSQTVIYTNVNGKMVKHISFMPVKRNWWGEPIFDE